MPKQNSEGSVDLAQRLRGGVAAKRSRLDRIITQLDEVIQLLEADVPEPSRPAPNRTEERFYSIDDLKLHLRNWSPADGAYKRMEDADTHGEISRQQFGGLLAAAVRHGYVEVRKKSGEQQYRWSGQTKKRG